MTKTVSKRELATYGVPYPSDNVTFGYQDKAHYFYNKALKKADTDKKYTVEAKRVKIEVITSTFEKLVFERCNFHSKGGAAIDLYNHITFDEVDFRQCLLGTNKYYRVIFKNCSFDKCDFKDAEFEECIFINCIFTDCTAYHCRFSKTDIKPDSFLNSINFPIQNFAGLEKYEIDLKEKEWPEVSLFLANQLFISNRELGKSKNADEALVLIKRTSIVIEKNKSKEDQDYLSLWGAQLNLYLTEGGTSFEKLIYLLIGAVFVLGIILSYADICYSSEPLWFENNTFTLTLFCRNIFLGLSLFLSFGYSSFSTVDPLYQVLLTISSCLGLIWYALVIQVILRKIYI